VVSIRLFTLHLVVIAALVRLFHFTEDTTAINRSTVEYCIIKHSTPVPSSYNNFINTLINLIETNQFKFDNYRLYESQLINYSFKSQKRQLFYLFTLLFNICTI
jgi:hypothetical protein